MLRVRFLPCLCAVGAFACDGADGPADGVDDAADALVETDAGGDAGDGDGSGDDAGGAPCEDCHGGGGHANPPRAVDGAAERSARGVGAHEAHLAASDWRAPVRCAHCHRVPTGPDDVGHIDATRPADVTFSGLAAAAGAAADWDGASCAVYCHGAAMRVERRRSGAWTGSGGTTCTDCHGQPPGGPHPPAPDCGRCHLDVATPEGSIARPSQHIDSIVGAPHGAHIVHLGGALPSGPGADLPCDTCHPPGAYHGALRDGRTLEETTVCDPCHAPGTRTPSDWRDFPVLGS